VLTGGDTVNAVGARLFARAGGRIETETTDDPPRLARKAEDGIRRLNRQRDRRSKGNVNRRRTVPKLGRLYRHVADCCKDHMHKATRQLVDTHAGFAVETLNIKD